VQVELGRHDGLRIQRRAHGVLLLTIDRPDRHNALDESLLDFLCHIWTDIHRDPETRVVVVTGEGASFSAGADLGDEANLAVAYDDVVKNMTYASDLVNNMLSCEKPIIAAINGPAAGAGLTIALLSDVPMMAADARFTDAHARIGLAAGDHAAMLWPLACGMANAKYYLMTADFVDAQDALRLGLVSKVFPRDILLSEALALAERLATGSQTAIRFTKRALNQWLRVAQPTFELSLAFEMLNMFGPDAKEGMQAFIEKRRPAFPSAWPS
jgi:enoyl-CoA hydratase